MNRRQLRPRPTHLKHTPLTHSTCDNGAAINRPDHGGAEIPRKSEVMSATMKIAATFYNAKTLSHCVSRRHGRFKPSLTTNQKPPGTSNAIQHRAVKKRPSTKLTTEDPSIRDDLSNGPDNLVQATRVHCEEQLLSMRSFDGKIIAALGEQTAGNGEISSMLNLSSESSGRMHCSIEQIVGVEETLCSGLSKGGSDVAPIKQGIINSSMRESKTSKRIREVKPICQKSQIFTPAVFKTNLASDTTTPNLSSAPDQSVRGSPVAAISQNTQIVAIEDDFNIAFVLNPRHCGVQKGTHAYPRQLASSSSCAPSLLSTIQLSTSPSLRMETDDESVVFFAPKPETPARITRVEIFGDDPPTPSTYCPERERFSSFLTLTPSSQSYNDLQDNYLENSVDSDSWEQFRSNFVHFPQLNIPEKVSNGVLIIPTTSQVSLDDCHREKGDTPSAALLLPDVHHLEDQPKHPSPQNHHPWSQQNFQQFGFRLLNHQMEMDLLEKYRSQETEKIKEQLLLRARDKRRSREQAARCIDKTRFWRQVGHCGDRWPFMKTRKEREKPQKMAFVNLHVVEYGSNCRRLVETRVECRRKTYVDNKEFICPVRRGGREWKIVDPGDRRKKRSRLSQIFIKRK